jgi:DHA1 family bicyclomycin/chloramphenicol resistance-like MFS transporter
MGPASWDRLWWGVFNDGTPRPMGCVIALAGVGSLFCARFLVQAGKFMPNEVIVSG